MLIRTTFLILFVFFTVSCSKKITDDPIPTYHGILHDDVKTLDPANAYDSISLEVVPSIYETLFQYSYLKEPFQLEPLLAADQPKFSKDELTVTIPLRQDIYFHDDECFENGVGRKVTAQDYIYAIKRLAHPGVQSQGFWVIDGKIKGINAFAEKLKKLPKAEQEKAMQKEAVAGLKAPNDHTLVIELTKPYPQLLSVLAMSFTSPVPYEAIKKWGDENAQLNSHPVGTGPFVLKEWAHSYRVILEKNPKPHPDFFPTAASARLKEKGYLLDSGKPIPFLSRLEFSVFKEQSPAWLTFKQGEIDSMTIPKDQYQNAMESSKKLSPELEKLGVVLDIEPSLTFYYIEFNFKDSVVGKNKLLRQALSAAINRKEWIRIFTNNRGIEANHSLPPGIAGRDEKLQLKFPYNVEQARALLAKAGFKNGEGLPQLTMDMRGADTLSRQLGEFFVQEFSKLGIKLNVIHNSFPAFLEKIKKSNFQIAYGGWAMDYPDAENVYQLLYGSNVSPAPNEANFNNAEMNRLYEKMSVMRDSPERTKIISQMEAIAQEEMPWALGYSVTEYRVSQGWLKNVRAAELINNRFKYYRVNADEKKSSPYFK